MLKIRLTSVIILMCFVSLQAQNIRFKGRVLDAKTNQALPYANIQLMGKTLGCSCNQEGDFKLVLPADCTEGSIVVSYLGYLSDTLFISQLDIDENKLVIRLSPFTETLLGVMVNPPDLAKVITDAISNADSAYWNRPINMDAFYKEIMYVDGEAIKFNQAFCTFSVGKFRAKYDVGKTIGVLSRHLKDSIDYDKTFPIINGFSSYHPSSRVKINELMLLEKPSVYSRFYIAGGPLEALNKDAFAYANGRQYVIKEKKNYKKTYKYWRKNSDKIKYDQTKKMGQDLFEIAYKVRYLGNWEEINKFIIDNKNTTFNAYSVSVHDENICLLNRFITENRAKEAKDDVLYIDSVYTDVTYQKVDDKLYSSTILTKEFFSYIAANQDTIHIVLKKQILISQIHKQAEPLAKELSLPNRSWIGLSKCKTAYNAQFWEQNSMFPLNKEEQELLKTMNIINRYDE